MNSVVTVDVWDTLLRRHSHPEFSKIATARHVMLDPNANVKQQFSTLQSLYEERIRIEKIIGEENCKLGFDDEYRIADVFSRWIAAVLDSKHDSVFITSLISLELQFEANNTYVDPSICSFLESFPCTSRYFISDFYMSGPDILFLLRHHGLDKIVTHGITSADCLFNKRSGKLFNEAANRFSICNKQQIHIGDNPHSDVSIPNAMNIKSVLYQPSEEHTKRHLLSMSFEDREALFVKIHTELKNVLDDHAPVLSKNEETAFRMGVDFAIVLVGMQVLIAEKVLHSGVERLFFFTREGELFHKVWSILFKDNRYLGIELPPSEVLEVSRLSTFCPSIYQFSIEEMMRVWRLFSSQTLEAFFLTLGLTPEAFANFANRFGIAFSEKIDKPWQDARFLRLFRDETFLAHLNAESATQRSVLLQYLQQKNWTKSSKMVAIADIGWRGTIQDNLAKIMPECEILGFYLGLQRFLNPQPSNAKKFSLGPNANVAPEFSDLLDAVSPIEMLLNSPNGSVTGYFMDKSGVVLAKREIDKSENVSWENFSSYFQEGVLSATRVWSKYVSSHVLQSAELRKPACEVWRRIIQNPSPDFSTTYWNLNHNEIFGAGEYISKSEIPIIRDIVMSLISKNKALSLIRYLRSVQWPHGILVRNDLTFVHKVLIAALLQLAILFKHARNRIRVFRARFVCVSKFFNRFN